MNDVPFELWRKFASGRKEILRWVECDYPALAPTFQDVVLRVGAAECYPPTSAITPYWYYFPDRQALYECGFPAPGVGLSQPILAAALLQPDHLTPLQRLQIKAVVITARLTGEAVLMAAALESLPKHWAALEAMHLEQYGDFHAVLGFLGKDYDSLKRLIPGTFGAEAYVDGDWVYWVDPVALTKRPQRRKVEAVISDTYVRLEGIREPVELSPSAGMRYPAPGEWSLRQTAIAHSFVFNLAVDRVLKRLHFATLP